MGCLTRLAIRCVPAHADQTAAQAAAPALPPAQCFPALLAMLMPHTLLKVYIALHLQLFFKRSTLYIPFVLVGAYFANEVRSEQCEGLQKAHLASQCSKVQYPHPHWGWGGPSRCSNVQYSQFDWWPGHHG
jgi:hypothetical protein